MITGEYWKIQDDRSIRKIEDVALRLLYKTGARIDHDKLLDLLEGAGCRIDRSTMRCYFVEKIINEVLSTISKKANFQVTIPAGWDSNWRLSHAGSQPHYFDWPSCERRLATKQDVIDMAKMAHGLREYEVIGKVLTCSEVDQRIEPLWAVLQFARITNKTIGGGEIFYADYIEPLVRMGEILSGKTNDTFLIASCDFFTQPLILEKKQAECFIEKRKWKLPNVPGTMAVAGMTGPVTLAGTIALSLAELMAGWVIGFLLDPDLPAGGIVAAGSLDMRTMVALFGSPEAILINVSTSNIARRLYGIEVWPIVNYTDCKVPGLKATFDKMFGLLCVPFSQSRLIGTDGLLSAGQDYSPVQQILDNEMNMSVKRFWGHYEVNDDTLALEVMESVIHDGDNFLSNRHTRRHFKQESWFPHWLDRSPWRGNEIEAKNEEEMLNRINNYCREAIIRYETPAFDRHRILELEKIYNIAEKIILR